ncbi:MAG: SLC13 family permease [Synechococcaceae cyanobacterium]|nr:SLC13 family permease [Synechococcaceae cyanobacterium]
MTEAAALPSIEHGLAALNGDPLLGSLSQQDRSRLLGAIEVRQLQAGARLLDIGEPLAGLQLVPSGRLRVESASANGLAWEQEGGRWGDELLAGLDRSLFRITACEPLAVWSLPCGVLQEVIPRLDGAARHAAVALVQRLSSGGGSPAIPGLSSGVTAGAASSTERSPRGSARRRRLGLLCLAILPLFSALALLLLKAPVEVAIFSALLVMTVLMWAFALVDEYIPPLIALVASLFINLAPPTVALGAFGSPALLTLVSVFALAAMVALSGLGYRLMLFALLRLPAHPLAHQGFALGSGFLLSIFNPSGNARLALMLPLSGEAMSLLKLQPGGGPVTGLLMASFAGATLFSPMLATSKTANLTAVGMLPQQVQNDVLGLFWLQAAALSLVVLTAVQLLLCRQVSGPATGMRLQRDRLSLQLRLLGPLQPVETVALGSFLLYLGGLATGGLHQVAPAWIAGLVLVLLLLTGAFAKTDFRRSIDWALLFFLLSTDCLVKIMNYLGVSEMLGQAMSGVLAVADGRLLIFALFSIILTMALRLFLPVNPGMIVAFVILLPVAEIQGVSPWICLFMTSIVSDIWWLPFQSPHYMQIGSAGLLEVLDQNRFLRSNALLNLARLASILLSIPWWDRLGLI